MARGAVKAKQAQSFEDKKGARRNPPPAKGRAAPATAGGNPNQQLFFMRLRRQAKPAYLILAVLFAVTFAFLGVGSGSSGLGDLLSGNFSGLFGGSSTNSAVGKAEAKVKKHPNDVQAKKDLATALQSNNQFDRAIIVLEQVRKAAPKDTDAGPSLPGFYLRRADLARNRAQAIQAEQSASSAGQIFDIPSTSKLGKAIQGSSDPLDPPWST